MNEAILIEKEITALIMSTSRYLENLGEQLQAYPDEKPNPTELREIAHNIDTVANIREILFKAREQDKVVVLRIGEPTEELF